MLDKVPPEIRDLLPGAVGSAVALRWIDGPWHWRATAFVGGAFVAYIAAAPLTDFFDLGVKWIGVNGMLLGLVSISVIGKVLATIDAVQPASLVGVGMAWLRRKLGVSKEEAQEDKR